MTHNNRRTSRSALALIAFGLFLSAAIAREGGDGSRQEQPERDERECASGCPAVVTRHETSMCDR